MIRAKITTTRITPDHTPALKIPSISSQLDKVVTTRARIARILYFFMRFALFTEIKQQNTRIVY